MLTISPTLRLAYHLIITADFDYGLMEYPEYAYWMNLLYKTK